MMFKRHSINWMRTGLLGLSLVGIGLLGVNLLPTKSLRSTCAFGSSSSELACDPNIFVNLTKKGVPSVVNISSITTVKSPFSSGSPDDVLRKFFGDLFRQYPHGGRGGDNGDEDDDDIPPPPQGAPLPRMPKAMSLGTGFIIDASGLILTNNHVVADADEIKINFTEEADEKPTDAVVVGRDPEIDVALIRVKNKRKMIPITLGDSDSLQVGEYVMAIGNPFGQGHSVTHGIISAKGRQAPGFPLASYLQTDAPINPGNSGGPLLNLKGEVIGINNAIDQRAQGIGFAIPINLVKSVLPQLRSKGLVSRGYIGVNVDNLAPEVVKEIGLPKGTEAPMVSHVFPGEPAAKAGLQPYDVIVELNGKKIHSANELVVAVTSVPVGQSVPIKVYRVEKNGSGDSKVVTKVLNITVEQRPAGQSNGEKEEKGSSKKKKRHSIETGMTLEDITPEIARDLGLTDKMKGVVVSNLAYDGPATKAGLARGDVILEVDRKPVKNVDGFYSIVKAKKSYLLRVRRMDSQGQELFTVIVLDLK